MAPRPLPTLAPPVAPSARLPRSLSVVLWRGPSVLDGAPIMLVVTGLGKRRDSANRKTGAMIQTYILRADLTPSEAARTGADRSVCGSCPHRGRVEGTGATARNVGRSCYVTLVQGPLVAYKGATGGVSGAGPRAYVEGERAWPLALAGVAGRPVRVGSYGDPAAIPAHVWARLLAPASGWTGYTHQWRNPAVGVWARALLMASCDNEGDRVAASAAGWRTFRVLGPSETPRPAREIYCPASPEGGQRAKCEACQLCQGASRVGARDIAIRVHGTGAVNFSRDGAP
jgi:hypothetical protein